MPAPKVCVILFGFLTLALVSMSINADKSSNIYDSLNNFTSPGEASYFAVRTASGEFKKYFVGPIEHDSWMRFGSITKVFNAFFNLKHGIDLSGHLNDYFNPRHYSNSSIMTFRDVMSHHSGISEYATAAKLINAAGTDWSAPGGFFNVTFDIELGWKDQPLDFVPGTLFCYSNTNFEVMGHVLKVNTGKNLTQHLHEQYDNSLTLDDGEPRNWPNTTAYNNWPYPPTLPGESGTLIGTAKDLVDNFYEITQSSEFSIMNEWSTVLTKCDILGSDVAAGVNYGIGYQLYSPEQVYQGATGHDGDLIARSVLLLHPTGNIFMYHYTNEIDNPTLMQRANTLIRDYLI
jgi:CubicO group peptidase (beta-lactamase class C family)